MDLTLKEIEKVSNLSPFERYKYFIKKVADFEELWTIVYDNKDLALSEVDNNTLVSFWTSEQFIMNNLNGGWEKCIPLKIDLDDFESIFIPLIVENNYLVNIFPVNGKSGFVVNINEFTRDLNEELENYE